jgi:DNA-binding PadR family transcriptional regulator
MYFDIYILSYLMESPHYGYEIKKKLADSVGACASISNNTLYPILRKYEKMGAATKSGRPGTHRVYPYGRGAQGVRRHPVELSGFHDKQQG